MALFKWKTKGADANPGEGASKKRLDNPYINARLEWNERYGDYLKRMRTAQIMAAGAFGLSAVLAVSLAHIASQSKVQPYVVEVDKSGRVSSPVVIEKAMDNDSRIVRAQLADYITNARSVTSDPAVQKRWLDKVYIQSGQHATAYLNDYYKNSDPFSVGRSHLVSVKINTILPLSKESWQIEWEETKRSKEGTSPQTTRWKSIAHVEFVTPKNMDDFAANPTGMSLKQVSWTQDI